MRLSECAANAMDDFLWRAGTGGALLGAAAGPLGCFVLWRRMAYLGESVAHMGLLGAGLGLLLGFAPLTGVAATALVAALVMARAPGGPIPVSAFVGMVGHVGLALGFVLLASMETVRADLLGYLFGDVLALSATDVVIVGATAVLTLTTLALFWRSWLALAVSADIARAERRAGKLHEIAFLALVAAIVAVGLRVVGALLIVALILIPPAAARPLARTPEGMAGWAAAIAAASAPLGLAAAYWKDIPAGPSIVLAAAGLFVVASIGARAFGGRA
jgi:zinc transport system permease protein